MDERSLSKAPAPRDRILQVAGRLFSQQGYHGTSMRDLAAALGLTQASLYHHFKGKEALLLAITEGVGGAFLARLERIVGGQDCPPDKLRAAVRAHLQVVAENLETATVFLHEWKFLRGEARARVQALRDRYQAHFRAILAQGVVQGAFRPVEVEFQTLFILSALNWVYQWYSPQGALTAEEIAERYADLFLVGLLPR